MSTWLRALGVSGKALPLLSFPGIRFLGNVTVRQLVTDSALQAACMKAVADRLDAAAAVSFMDLSVEAEAFGAEILFFEDDVPAVTGALVTDEAEAGILGIPEVGAGRTEIYINAIRLAKEQITDRPVLAGAIGPFSLAGRLVDVSEAMYLCYDEPELLHDQSRRWLDHNVTLVEKLHEAGHLLDGFALCSDYCFNANPFFRPDQFEEFIVPWLKQGIDEYRRLGYYSIKHTDGNMMPILRQMADCRPDAIHSLDPQGGVSIPEVRKIVGDDICLIGNVNCGLLQTGSDEEMEADVLRSLREGMSTGRGYIFSTSNCAYTGLPLERYEKMIGLWREYGNYDRKH